MMEQDYAEKMGEVEYEQSNERKSKRIDGYLVSDIELCVQKNTEYYLDKFRSLPRRRMNGAALVFAGNWLAYRHMWREVAVVLLSQMAFSLLVTMILIASGVNARGIDPDQIRMIDLGCLVVYCAVVGYVGDSLYWKKIKRELDRFGRKNSATPMTDEEKSVLQNRMRPSGVNVIIAIVIFTVSQRVFFIAALFFLMLIF